jgi:hypothetical protein
MDVWLKQCFFVLLWLGGSAAIQAQPRAVAVVFDNGPMDFVSGHEATHWTVAEDFVPAGPEDITTVSMGFLDVTCDGLLEWDGELRWWVYGDSGGANPLPSGLVATGFAPVVGVTLDVPNSTCPGGWAWYDVFFPLGQSLDLSPGVRYWLAIHLGHEWPALSEGPYWATTAATGAQLQTLARSELGVDPWVPGGHHLSFELTANTLHTWIFYDGFESGDTSLWSWAP